MEVLDVNDDQNLTGEISRINETGLHEEFLNLINFMINNSIFNTFITAVGDDTHFSIILRKKVPKLSNLLMHLEKYSKIKNDDQILGSKCSICFEEYKIGEYKRCLKNCQHIYHKKCIDKWFKKNWQNMSCPLCRVNYNKNEQ